VGRAPGTRVYVFAGASGSPMLERDWWFLVGAGLFFAAVGAPFVVFGLRGLRFDTATFAATAVAAAYLAWKTFRFLHRAIDTRCRPLPQALSPVTASEIASAQAASARQRIGARPWLIGIGAVVLLGSILWLRSDLAFRAHALLAHGIVLENEAAQSGDSPVYHAVVRYTDAQGAQHVFRDSFGSAPAWYAPGQAVPVLYQPPDARIDRGIWSWLPAVALALAGLAALLGGLALYRRRAGLPPGAGV
jgi:hypothetical protein